MSEIAVVERWSGATPPVPRSLDQDAQAHAVLLNHCGKVERGIACGRKGSKRADRVAECGLDNHIVGGDPLEHNAPAFAIPAPDAAHP